jgi:hypothetical protein
MCGSKLALSQQVAQPRRAYGQWNVGEMPSKPQADSTISVLLLLMMMMTMMTMMMTMISSHHDQLKAAW